MKRKQLSECGCCGSEEPSFIFNVRLRGVYRRLCTVCVLKNHPGSFCPVCFEVYDGDPPPPHARAMCLNCPSISHLSCASAAGASNAAAAPRYQCPPCKNPSYSFFDVGQQSVKKIKGDGGESVGIDEELAKRLVAAAQVAVASMNKAVAVARVEAERRVKEAAAARKRAREALERVAFLVSKEEIDSKSLTGEQKVNPKIGNSFLAGKQIQNQINEEGQIRNGGGEKKANGLNPGTRH